MTIWHALEVDEVRIRIGGKDTHAGQLCSAACVGERCDVPSDRMNPIDDLLCSGRAFAGNIVVNRTNFTRRLRAECQIHQRRRKACATSCGEAVSPRSISAGASRRSASSSGLSSYKSSDSRLSKRLAASSCFSRGQVLTRSKTALIWSFVMASTLADRSNPRNRCATHFGRRRPLGRRASAEAG